MRFLFFLRFFRLSLSRLLLVLFVLFILSFSFLLLVLFFSLLLILRFFAILLFFFLFFQLFNLSIFCLNSSHGFREISKHILKLLLAHFWKIKPIGFKILIPISDSKSQRFWFIFDDLFFLFNSSYCQILLILCIPFVCVLFLWDQCSDFWLVIWWVLLGICYDL